MKIKALVVDDEIDARESIVSLLEQDPDIVLAGECANGAEALAFFENNHAELVFLDVQMPVVDGFSFLAQASFDPMPLVIFVTAYDQYAVKAFEEHALDYLVKPFSNQRFQAALARAKTAAAQGRSQDFIPAVNSLRGPYLRRLVVGVTGGGFVVLPIGDIHLFSGESVYARVHTPEKSYLLRMPLNELEEKLDPSQFLRVHRSSIVQLNAVREIHPYSKNDFEVTLAGGTKVKLSRQGYKKLKQTLSC